MIDIEIPIIPFGKESIRGGKNAFFKSEKTRGYMTFLKHQMRLQYDEPPLDGAVSVMTTFIFPISGFSRIKGSELDLGKPMTSKPDLDNLEKSLYDSANGILFNDDCQVVHHTSEKIWGKQGKILMTITSI